MPYIDRVAGQITGLYARPQREGQEYLADDSVEMVAYYAEKVQQENLRKVKAKLAEIDLKSIRSLREWVVAQPNAPQFIKDYEESAAAERVKLK